MFKQLALGPKKGGTVCIVGVPCVPAASLPPAIGACAERPSPGAYAGLKYQITILVERVVLADRSLSDTVSYGASPAREHDQAVIVCQRGSKIASTQAVPLNAGQAPCPLPALGRITARAGRALARTCAHYSAAGEPVGGERVALCASHQRSCADGASWSEPLSIISTLYKADGQGFREKTAKFVLRGLSGSVSTSNGIALASGKIDLAVIPRASANFHSSRAVVRASRRKGGFDSSWLIEHRMRVPMPMAQQMQPPHARARLQHGKCLRAALGRSHDTNTHDRATARLRRR